MSSGLEDRFQTLHEIVRAAKQRLLQQLMYHLHQ